DDNHFIRQLAPMTALTRPSAPEAMADFETQNDNAPIILVSAEGGGIRAAHFTATVLGRLADQCPRLARRIFAISGVSGGAVGAAAYRASLDAAPLEGDQCDLGANRPVGPRQQALNSMFSRDHLSPILAKEMFPELIQTFAPASFINGQSAFLPQTDRQLAFELSLEQAFANSFHLDANHNPFAASAFGAGGRAEAPPYLLINMTEVSSGSVFVASPLDLADLRKRNVWLHDFRCIWSAASEADEPRCNQSPDFRLSTMAATSARFPLISPAGSVRAENNTFRFVDGGYFDNSGVETLLAVIDHLQRDARANNRPLPRIAVLHIDSNPYRQRLPVKWRLDFDVHELQAVLATREERVRISLTKLNNLYQDQRICSLRFVEVSENRVPLRLGWILSHTAANALQAQAAQQLAIAYQGDPPPTCDGDESAALHAATDRYAERLAMGPVGAP
ncbi:MAG TPA: patatin-like phospholipase family protein, partial [Caulobacterales bacterium]|nr:patatin-like phospholipase family protein [Caulobacterales bacterium]